jgi:hypothetical protein
MRRSKEKEEMMGEVNENNTEQQNDEAGRRKS